MPRVFFDIETYSPGPRPTYNDKVIAIAFKPEGGEVTVLKEWESGEKQILNNFLEEMSQVERLSFVGHNILRFDLPVIVCRASHHDLAPLKDLLRLLFDSYSIDTIQALLPGNNYFFRGLGLADCARGLGIETSSCPSSDILTRYESGDYEAITEHVIEDVLITEKLFDSIPRSRQT